MKSPDEYTVNVESSRGTKEFQFDAIFMEDSTQEKIFEDTNVNILTNVHVFASSFLFQNYYDLLTKLKMSLNKKTLHFPLFLLPIIFPCITESDSVGHGWLQCLHLCLRTNRKWKNFHHDRRQRPEISWSRSQVFW